MISHTTLLQQLRWRYATKKFDSTKTIPAADWQALEEALVLTPSSYGLQPWRFIVITDPATKEKLVPVSWGQRQVADASHLVVFTIKKNMSAADVDRHLERIAAVRGGTAQSLASFRKMMLSDVIEGPRSKIVNEWATRQVYIALGNFMTSAAMLGIDTCPLEGIEPEKYDAILGLPARGLATMVGCVAGYRAADDKYAALPKVRFPHEAVIERI
ncbi:MAG: putative NAD(P)H nitroreductase YfkO [Verrucomicrobiae bacterium]|nr:putative NAD(P)H nitroreductase YfkO [Verrucomicrobiae bacterium]